MKYNEIIHVSDEFIPVFDLENEETDQYWPLFIPNDKFRDILSSVIDSLNTENQKHPVWLQGTYGTGKTHATSVIKHLLCDRDLPDYDLEDNQLTAKLNNFRDKNNVFPVILKGTSTIDGPRRFALTIQTAVRKALKKNNMRVAVSSDFEHMIRTLEDIPLKHEEVEGTNLEFFDNDEIILKLKNEDTDILIDVEDIFINKKGLNPVTQENIVDWLINVRNKLNDEFGIDYLMIFWDEFTGALNKLNVEDILLQIQNIAEAKNKGLSLFIVSHRTRSTQVNINQEIIDKIMDRFERKFYSMEPVATYELMERSIKKENEWEDVKDRFIDTISSLIDKISANEGPKVKKALEDLYPIHPYTAFLATFIAQEIGSTERSIFKFLHDDIENGFRSFINTFEIDERYFLTADYLWDFFYADFEQSEDEKISSSVKKYKLHVDSLEKMDEEYLVIFKVILLLNVLYKIAEVGKGSLAIPSRWNIKNVFMGSIYQDKVGTVLDYIDKQNIINKTPDGLFELTTNSLPVEQVNSEMEKLRKNIKLYDLLYNKKSNISTEFSSKVLREIEVDIRDASISENRLISDIEKGIFKESGYLHMILFLCKTNEEYISINKIIKSVFEKNLLKDIIVVVSEAILGEENFNKYLEFKARAKVAENHNYTEDVELNNKHAKKYVDGWVKDIKRKSVSWYLNDDESKLPLSNFIKYINTDLSKSIFYHGLENITETLENRNLWPKVVAKNQAEKFLTSNTFKELDDNLNGVDKQSLSILKDNTGDRIVNDYLKIKDTVSDNHPIMVMQSYVDKTFDDAQIRGQFNLGRELMPLTEAPYGLYPNKLNVAAISFVLRKYVNRLYDSKGNSIDKTKMKNIVISLFEFWSKGRKENDLFIRFGSENEKKLCELINDIFDLGLDSNNQSISTVRWEFRKWIKNNRSPLWLFKYSDYIEKNPSVSQSIDALFDFLKPKDNNLPDNLIQDCYNSVKANKSDLKWCIKEDADKLFYKFLTTVEENLTPNQIHEINEYLDRIMPEEVYDWDKNTVEINVLKWMRGKNKCNPNLLVSVMGSVISVSLDDEASGEIILHVGGKKFSKEIVNGGANFDLSNLDGGKTYSVMVSYNGDENFSEDNITVEVAVERKNPNMEVSIDGNKITVSIDKNATGNILVDVDKGYFAKIKNGIAIINLSGLEGGKTYKGTISYEGDGKFNDQEIILEFTAERENPNLDVSVDGGSIAVSLNNDATGDIIVEVDGKEYSKEIINGNVIFNIPDLDAGKNYSATINYTGTTRFNDAKTTVELKIKSTISIESIEKSDAAMVKDALIQALKNNKEITIELIINYLERINGGDS